MKLKNAETGEIVEVFSLTREGPGAGTVKGLVFSREQGRWEEILVQIAVPMAKSLVYWVPAEQDVDY